MIVYPNYNVYNNKQWVEPPNKRKDTLGAELIVGSRAYCSLTHVREH